MTEAIGCEVTMICVEVRVRLEKSEFNRLQADSNKMIHRFSGWKSHVPFNEGMAKMANWIGRKIQKLNAECYTVLIECQVLYCLSGDVIEDRKIKMQWIVRLKAYFRGPLEISERFLV
ncbi:hypothetical protein [uncultured Gimesia sp.]|uniref:hypothetical protein n=1 Tax=uncultured Gimesia sp. TaxID=1678688 RepID=UPI0030DD6444|tara:strand:- start:18578 stop:18931 length:354 start_codon:yes stop_codon:yes gene_type:complete